MEIPARAVKRRVYEIFTDMKDKAISAPYATQKGLIEEIEKQKTTYSKTGKGKIGF
jgi:hypothetical protein